MNHPRRYLIVSVVVCLVCGAANLYMGTWYNEVAGGIALFAGGVSLGHLMMWRLLLPRGSNYALSSGLTTEEEAIVAALHFRETIKKMHAGGEFPPGLQFEFPDVTVRSKPV
jgi:hypothetical protein